MVIDPENTLALTQVHIKDVIPPDNIAGLAVCKGSVIKDEYRAASQYVGKSDQQGGAQNHNYSHNTRHRISARQADGQRQPEQQCICQRFPPIKPDRYWAVLS